MQEESDILLEVASSDVIMVELLIYCAASIVILMLMSAFAKKWLPGSVGGPHHFGDDLLWLYLYRRYAVSDPGLLLYPRHVDVFWFALPSCVDILYVPNVWQDQGRKGPAPVSIVRAQTPDAKASGDFLRGICDSFGLGN